MEPSHSHPAYEETLPRVATILDVIAQEDREDQRALAERGRALAGQEAGTTEQRQAMTRIELAISEYMEDAKIRDAEPTDKLNGLIELMDRHVREHDRK